MVEHVKLGLLPLNDLEVEGVTFLVLDPVLVLLILDLLLHQLINLGCQIKGNFDQLRPHSINVAQRPLLLERF